MSLCVFRNHNANIIHGVGRMSLNVLECPPMSLDVLKCPDKEKKTGKYLL